MPWSKPRATVFSRLIHFILAGSKFPHRPAPALPCAYFAFDLSNSGKVGAGREGVPAGPKRDNPAAN